MTRGHPVLCGVFRRNDKLRVFRGAEERERKRKNDADDNDDNDDRLVATVAGNVAFIPIRRYDTPKRSAACSFACASVQQWYQPYTRLS